MNLPDFYALVKRLGPKRDPRPLPATGASRPLRGLETARPSPVAPGRQDGSDPVSVSVSVSVPEPKPVGLRAAPLETPLDLLDFEIHVLPGSRKNYAVHTRSSRFGEANDVCRLDPQEEWITDVVDLLHARCLDRGQLEHFGRLLLRGDPAAGFHGLLSGRTLEHYRYCQGAVEATPGASMRVLLRIEPPELNALPLEYLFDPERQVFLATDPRCLLLRTLSAPRPPSSLEATLPLRVLHVMPQALDLNLGKERAALKALSQSSGAQLRWEVLEGPVSAAAIRARLAVETFHILHFSGHGEFDSEGTFLLEGAGGERLDERSLSDLVHDHPSIRLVVLNACHTGRFDVRATVGGMAQRLLLKGVPSVVVMQQPVQDDTAILFAEAFYQNLFRGPLQGHVASAMNAARAALLTHLKEDAAGFGAPVLYLRSSEDRLFVPAHLRASGSRGEGSVEEKRSDEAPSRRRVGQKHVPLLCALLVLVALLLRWQGLFEGVDTWRHDAYLRVIVSPVSHPEVVGLELSERVEPWPWRRETLARLVETLVAKGGMRTIVLDATLSDGPRSEEDGKAFEEANRRLREAAARAAERQPPVPIIIATGAPLLGPDPDSALYSLKPWEPPAGLETLSFGFSRVLSRRGEGVLRHVPLVAGVGEPPGPPFTLALAAMAVSDQRQPLLDMTSYRIRLGDRWIGTDRSFRCELPRCRKGFPRLIDASSILSEGADQSHHLSQLRNKIVLLGVYSSEQVDPRATPWGYESGVRIQASIIATLLEGRCVHRAYIGAEILLAALMLSLLVRRQRARNKLVTIAALAILAVLIEVNALRRFDLRLNGPLPELLLASLMVLRSMVSERLSSGFTVLERAPAGRPNRRDGP